MESITRAVEAALGTAPVEVTPLDGGMIGTVERVDLADGRTVVAKRGPNPLGIEAEMLAYLAETTDLPVPAVLGGDDDLLLLEYLPGESRFDRATERDAAAKLASLHATTADAHGFERDTLIGELDQPNPWTDSWAAFFGEHRLEHMAEAAVAEGSMPPALGDRVASLVADLVTLLHEPRAPALLHGDVWRTNVLAVDGEITGFLDPAIYYGDPEVELAYVDWTNTFGEAFFERYRELADLPAGVDDRRPVYQLYPILFHVRHFGGGYVDGLRRALSSLGY